MFSQFAIRVKHRVHSRRAWRLFCALSAIAVSQTAWSARTQVVDTELHRLSVEVITEGLDHPWSLAFLPDGRMLVTERSGRLRLISPAGKLDPRPIQGLPDNIRSVNQGGLLDVVPHPQFSRNSLIYLSYTGEGADGFGTELARAKLTGHRLSEVKVLFKALPKSTGGRHFGSRIVFDNAGHVFLTLGDRGRRSSAQNLNDHAGSVIRLNVDGSIPKNNPFIGKKARPEIYSLGNRNVQGAALHPVTGELWTHEHGPQGGDELNIIRAGVNYGWPVITYGVNYGFGTSIGEGTSKPGMAQPLHFWDPSIAPSGMAIYDGDKFPNWRGDVLIGALKFRLLTRLKMDGERVVREERMLEGLLGRIRDVRIGPDGYIYLLTDASNGLLARLKPL